MAAECPDYRRASRSSISGVLRLLRRGLSGAGAGDEAELESCGPRLGGRSGLVSHPAWDDAAPAPEGGCGDPDVWGRAERRWGAGAAALAAQIACARDGGGCGGAGAYLTPGGLPSTAEVEAPASPTSCSSGGSRGAAPSSSAGSSGAPAPAPAAAAAAVAAAAAAAGGEGGGGAGRYAELLQRLAGLLPAARRAAAARCYYADEDAESAWERVTAELTYHASAAKEAAAAAPHLQLQLPDGGAARLRQLLGAIEQQVGGGNGAATAQEYQLASVISSIYSLTGPATPRRAPASGDGSPSPRGAAPGGAGGGGAAAAGPKRTGWGRSVAAQESGLWNASPFHPASTSAEPTPRTARGSSFTGGAGSPAPRAPSGRATPRRDGSFTGGSWADALPAASPRGGGGGGGGGGPASARCSSGSSRSYSPAGGLSANYGRLPSDAAMKLAALYAMPKKPESPNKMGYRVASTTNPGSSAPPGAPAGRGGAAGGRAAFGSISLACSRSSSTTGLMYMSFAPEHRPAAAMTLGDTPGFSAAKEAFLANGLASVSEGAGRQDKWLARLMSSSKAMSADDVDAAIGRLVAVLGRNGIPLQLERVAPFTYSMGGKRLHIREVNGRMLVRTGGGYEELLSALAKLPWSPAAAAAATATAAAARHAGAV